MNIIRAFLRGAGPIAICLVGLGEATTTASAQVVENPRLAPEALRTIIANSSRGNPMPSDVADLDRLWAHQDLLTLMPRLRAVSSPGEVMRNTFWERMRIADGAGYVMVSAYMFDLQRLASVTPVSTSNKPKELAGLMWTYGLVLIALDGLKCADPSAPSHWRDQLTTGNPDLARFIAGSSKATRMTMGTRALAFEAGTAALQRNDEVLCGGGSAEMSASLLALGETGLSQIPPTPGQIGRTYSIPTAPGFKPKFVNEAIWRQKQNEMRPRMAAMLTKILTVPLDGAKATLPEK